MDTIFLVKIALSFFIGGSWVVLATHLADKLGSKIGGLITGLPSTLLFGLFFLGWTQSSQAAVTATSITPLVGGISSLFLAIYVATISFGLVWALGISIVSWVTLTFIALKLPIHNYYSLFLVYFLLTLLTFLYMENIAKVRAVAGKKIVYSRSTLILRGLLSGLIIASSVVLGKVSGPLLGGVLALFPAMFTSTLAISYLSHGAEFSKSLAKSALLASISIIVYSVVVRFTYIPLGIVVGTLISAAVSTTTGYLLFRFAISRMT